MADGEARAGVADSEAADSAAAYRAAAYREAAICHPPSAIYVVVVTGGLSGSVVVCGFGGGFTG
jgi:hypothetical protein